MFLVSLIPITRTDEVISTSFTVRPGESFDPYDEGTYYHTRVLAKSILNIHINVEGVGLHILASGQNVHGLKDVRVEGRETYTIAPANDQYSFTFTNKGIKDCVVEFVLTEVWTGSLSPHIWVLGYAGLLLMVPIGIGIFAYNYYANNREMV